MSHVSGREAFVQLQRLARESNRGNTQQLLELYLHERFLARLAASDYRDRFVLKGGMLLGSFDIRRPTHDADVLAIGIPLDELESVISEIAAIELPDGVQFAPEEIGSRRVRDANDYPGVRVTLPASLATARLRLSIDVNFDDPVAPREIEIPPLLDDEPIRLLGYPITTVIAEKVETMIARGDANTRDRDYADVLLLSMVHPLREGDLKTALVATAQHRGPSCAPSLRR